MLNTINNEIVFILSQMLMSPRRQVITFPIELPEMGMAASPVG